MAKVIQVSRDHGLRESASPVLTACQLASTSYKMNPQPSTDPPNSWLRRQENLCAKI